MTAFPKSPPVRDRAYLDWIATEQCLLWATGCCCAGTDPHHAGLDKGTGLKASDTSAIPLCRVHHDEWHDAKGYFKGWAKWARREWALEQIDIMQAKWAIRGGLHVEAFAW